MVETVPSEVIGKLREALVGLRTTGLSKEIVEPRDAVLARYHPVFSPEHIPDLTKEEFCSFLLFENNHHWTGLHRHREKICADMSRQTTLFKCKQLIIIRFVIFLRLIMPESHQILSLKLIFL